MSNLLLNKYIWLVDVLSKRGPLTLRQLSDMWEANPDFERRPLSRRTFYNYRQGIEDVLGITIECDPATYEYSLRCDNETDSLRQQWIIDSVSVNGMLNEARDLAERIVIDEVPSARTNLPVVLDAMREGLRLKFTYRSYTRLTPTYNNVVEPYFMKIFQRVWYLIGRNVAQDKIKTYALDRMTAPEIVDEPFNLPPLFSPQKFFRDCYGITSSPDAPMDIVLKVDATQANYFRAVPLHHSQREELGNGFSLFSYRMCNTFDLRARLLSHGPAVEVLEPKELRQQMARLLRESLARYSRK